MSPTVRCAEACARRFPRVSGDEPMSARKGTLDHLFSPRERG